MPSSLVRNQKRKIEPTATTADLTPSPLPRILAPEVALAVHRFLFALLIAVGVALAPVGAAMAALTQAQTSSMADMPDCSSKANQTSKDCGCCDTEAPCQSDLCLAKAFKLNGEIVKSAISFQWSEAAFVGAASARPPDSWPEPEARPPRT